MVLQLFPQDFVVDDHPGHRDPRKMTAARLELNVHLVTASAREHNALVGAVNQAHLVVEETVFEAQAAWYAAVRPEERREGVALVDIGAESTSLVVYYDEAMCLASGVRVCGGPLHQRPGARPVHQPGGGRAGEDRIRVRECQGFAREHPGGIAGAGGPRAAAGAEAARGPDPGSARPRVVSTGARRAGAGEHGAVAARRRLPVPAAAPDWRRFSKWRQTSWGASRDSELRWESRIGRRRWTSPEWCTAAGLAMYSAKLKAQTERQRAAVGWLSKIL